MKYKYKLLSLFFSLLAVVTTPAWAVIAEGVTTGATGKGSMMRNTFDKNTATTISTSGSNTYSVLQKGEAKVKWSISDAGVLTISKADDYTGVDCGGGIIKYPMPNFTTANMAPWYKYASKITSIVIEEGLTSVGEYAFYSKPEAYLNCTSVTLPSTLEILGQYSFANTRIAGEVRVPDNVVYMGYRSFYSESGKNGSNTAAPMTSIVYPKSLIYSYEATREMFNITSVTIPEGTRCLNGSLAFYHDKALTNVTFPSTLTYIGSRMFEYCEALTKVDLPVGIQTISTSNPWGRCTKLKNIEIGGQINYDNGKYKVVDGVLFSSDGKKLICYPAGHNLEEYEIPEGVEEICPYAFYSAGTTTTNKLKRVIMPTTLVSIGNEAFYNANYLESLDFSDCYKMTSVGQEAFISCTRMTNVILPASIKEIKGAAFSNVGTDKSVASIGLTVSIAGSPNLVIEDGYIYQINDKGEKIVLVLSLSSNKDTHYTLPSTVSTICRDAFYNNNYLESIDLSQGGSGKLTNIEYRAFRSCKKLKSVVVPDQAKLNGDAFMSCTSLVSAKLPAVQTSLSYDFSGCTALKSIVIPKNITTIGTSAFNGCTSLESVTFEAGSALTKIGGTAFNNCTSLKSIDLPTNFKTIDFQAFLNCSALETVKVGKNVSEFGFQNFRGCSSLKTVIIKRRVPPIINADSFDGAQVKANNCSVIVPCGTEGDYLAAPYYADFFVVQEDENLFDERPIGNIYAVVEEGCEEMGTVEVTTKLACGNINPVLEAIPNLGYSFVQWTDGEQVHNRPEFQDDRGSWEVDVTWTASFEPTTFRVELATGLTGGSISAQNSNWVLAENEDYLGQAYLNDPITITPSSKIGFECASITVTTKGGNNCETTPVRNSETNEIEAYTFNMPADDVNVTATFVKKVYPINITVTEGAEFGHPSAVMKGEAVTGANFGDRVTISPKPAEDYEASIFVQGGTISLDALNSFIMPASPVEVTISYLPVDYTVPVGESFDLGNFRFTVTELGETNKVTVAVRDENVGGDLEVPMVVTYNKIVYATEAITEGGFNKGGVISSVTFTEEEPLPIRGSQMAFGAGIMIKVPCGTKSAYVSAGYANNHNEIVSTSPYPYSVAATKVDHGSVIINKQPDCDDHSAKLTAIPDAGYSFSQWNTGVKTAILEIADVTADQTLTPSFSAITYTILISAEGSEHGSITVSSTTGIIGDEISVSVTPDEGYIVDEIIINNGAVPFVSATGTFTMPAANVEVSARYTAKQYDIIVSSMTNGTVTPSADKSTIGQTITLDVKPSVGYSTSKLTVTGVSDSKPIALSGNSFVMPAQNVRVNATFSKNIYTISINNPANGTASIDKNKASIGDEITVTTTAHSGAGENYVLKSIVVTTAGGSSVTVKDNKFKMPADNVSVEVTFDKAADFVVGNEFVVGNFRYTVTSVSPLEVSVKAKDALTGVSEITLVQQVTYLGKTFTVVSVEKNGFTACKDLRDVNSFMDPIPQAGPAFNSGLTLHINCSTTTDYKAAGYTNFATYDEVYSGPLVSVKSNDDNLGRAIIDRQQNCAGNAIVKAIPNTGCYFVKWSDGSTAPDYMLYLESNTTLTASFAKTVYDVNVEVTTNTASLNTGSVTAVSSAYYNDNVTLTVNPAPGYKLGEICVSYLSGEESVKVPFSDGKFTMPAANVTVSVSFVAVPFNIVAAETTGGSINVIKSATVGQRVSVSAIPKEGYEIDQALKVTYGAETAAISNGQFTMPASDVTVSATFRKIVYNVYLADGINNGVVTRSQTTASIGDQITVSTKPNDGYELDYLRFSDGTAIVDGKFQMPAHDVVIEASFIEQAFAITKVTEPADGGTFTVANVAKYKSTVSITNIKANTGYELASVKTDKAVVNLADDKKSATFEMPIGNVEVTVSFQKTQYNIDIAAADGGTVKSTATKAVMGDNVTLNILADNGYKIKSITATNATVSIAADGLSATFDMPAGNVVATPVFEKIDYSITIGSVTNGTLKVAGNKTKAQVGDKIGVICTPNAGCHFISFSINGEIVSLTDNQFTMPASNVELTAIFSKTGYGISVAAGVVGGTVNAEKSTANYGDVVKLTIVPETGYEFVSLGLTEGQKATISEVDKEALTAKLTMADENAVLLPKFKQIDYTVSFSANNGNTAETVSTAKYGETVMVTLNAAKGYKFESITADGIVFEDIDTNKKQFTMPATNVSGSATFSLIDYDIKIYESANGAVTCSQTTANYQNPVVLTVTPDKGYKLATLNASTGTLTVAADKKSATLTMDAAAVEITATFELEGYSITYEAAANGSLSGPATATFGTPVLVEIIPNTGYRVKTGSLKATAGIIDMATDGLSATLTMDAAPTSVSVEFEAIDYAITYSEASHGLISGAATAQYNNNITVTIEPEEHYKLNELLTSAGKLTVAADSLSATLNMPASNVTLTATFVKKLYPINLHYTGTGSIRSNKKAAAVGDIVTVFIENNIGSELSSFSVEGATVEEWAEDKSYVKITVNASQVDVYATFAVSNYNIKVEGETNGHVDVPKVGTYLQAIELDATADEGYELENISINGVEREIEPNGHYSFVMPAQDIDIVVSFTASKFDIEVATTEGGSITVPSSATYGDSVIISNIKAATGYEFVTVTTDKAAVTLDLKNGIAKFAMPASAVVVTPSFRLIDYDIVIDKVEGGVVTADKVSAKMGNTVGLAITAQDGYDIKQIDCPVTDVTVDIAADKKTASFTMPAADVVLTPVFDKLSYNVNVDPAIANGTLTVAGGITSAKVGDVIEVTCTPQTGFHFVNFYINGEAVTLSDGNTFVMPAEDVMLSATYSKTGYGISVQSVEGGTVSAERYEANAGEEIGLSIVPATGYHFVSVGVAEGQKATISNIDPEALTAKLTMAAENATVIALFEKTNYTVNFTATEGNTVKVSNPTANYRDQVSLTFEPGTGFKFNKIMASDIECVVAKDSASATFEMPAHNVEGTVEFSKILYPVRVFTSLNGSVTAPNYANYNETIKLSITPEVGYKLSSLTSTFGNLDIAADSLSATLVMDARATDIEAKFERSGFPITYLPAQHGSIDGPVSAYYNQTVTLNIKADKGYRVDTITSSSNQPVNVNATGLAATFTMGATETSLTASFVPLNYKVTYEEAAHGSINGATTAKYGEDVTVSIAPAEGYRLGTISVDFGNISVSADSTSAVLTMDAFDAKVSASFVEVETETPEEPEKPECDEYQEAPAVSLYDWLLMVDKVAFEKMGYNISDANVTWYKVVGNIDEPCAENFVADDEQVGTGLYYTSETNLLGSGDYYAIIDVDGQKFRTEPFEFTLKGVANINLAPTYAHRGQTIRILGLYGEADVTIYDAAGRTVRTLKTDGCDVYSFRTEDKAGVYFVRVMSEGNVRVIKCLVK